MRRLVCAFVVRKTSHVVAHIMFSELYLEIQYSSAHVLFQDSIQNTRIVDKHVLHLEMKNLFLDAYSNLN